MEAKRSVENYSFLYLLMLPKQKVQIKLPTSSKRIQGTSVVELLMLIVHDVVYLNSVESMLVISSIGRGGSSPPIGLKSMQNRTFLELLRPSFAQKMKTALPRRDLGAEVEKELPEEPFEFPIFPENSVSISMKTIFFFEIT